MLGLASGAFAFSKIPPGNRERPHARPNGGFEFLARFRISLSGPSSKNEKLNAGLYLRRCRPDEVSEADYAKAKQRNHNIIFEFLKHFCKFSFYDFHFIIPFGLGGSLWVPK